MSESLSNAVSKLEAYMPQLEKLRTSDTFLNDLYEATFYWCELGRWILQNNTKVNYPERAHGERELLSKLDTLLRAKPLEVQVKYGPLLIAAGDILHIAGQMRPPKVGHLGFLRAVRECFQFLQTDFGLSVTREEPTSLVFSSGTVYLELKYALSPWMSCQFGPESDESRHFSIQDLLYLYGDQRYRTLPKKLEMNTEGQIEDWFTFIAGVFKQYGSEVLRSEPGIFDRLAQAQTKRDAEFVAAINRSCDES